MLFLLCAYAAWTQTSTHILSYVTTEQYVVLFDLKPLNKVGLTAQLLYTCTYAHNVPTHHYLGQGSQHLGHIPLLTTFNVVH